jgi:ketosteroid isomerase-like protein
MNNVATDNVQLFRKIIDRGFCQGDLSVADEICATKLSEHEYLAKTDVPGPEILKDQIRDARSSIKGLVLTIEDIVESDGTVWARSRATGSDPRSGKPVSIYVIDICRFENGKMVEHWGVPDRFALLHQIGALPPKPPSALWSPVPDETDNSIDDVGSWHKADRRTPNENVGLCAKADDVFYEYTR